jgi:hypothetical protein
VRRPGPSHWPKPKWVREGLFLMSLYMRFETAVRSAVHQSSAGRFSKAFGIPRGKGMRSVLKVSRFQYVSYSYIVPNSPMRCFESSLSSLC